MINIWLECYVSVLNIARYFLGTLVRTADKTNLFIGCNRVQWYQLCLPVENPSQKGYLVLFLNLIVQAVEPAMTVKLHYISQHGKRAPQDG